MRGLICVLLGAAAGLASAQDQEADLRDRVQKLVDQLGSEDFEAREKAEEKLIEIGPPAIETLKGALGDEDPEVAQRARRAIEAIRRAQVVENVIHAGTKVSVDVQDVPLEDAAKAVGEEAGLVVRVSEAARNRKVTLRLEEGELLRALDSLGRQADAAYRFDGTTTVVYTEEPFEDLPVAYSGPFKFSVVRTRTATTREGEARTTDLEISIRTEWEPTVKPSAPSMRLTKALDAEGNELEWEKSPEGGPGLGRSVSSMTINGRTIRIVEQGGKLRVIRDGGDGPDGADTLTLRGIRKPLSTLSRLYGEASFVVQSDSKKPVVFESPVEGDSVEVGGLRIVLEEIDDDEIEAEIVSLNGGPLPERVLVKDSIVLRAGEKDYEARLEDDDPGDWGQDPRRMVRRLRRMTRGHDGSRFVIRVPEEAGDIEGRISRLQFTVREVVGHAVGFEFEDLELR